MTVGDDDAALEGESEEYDSVVTRLARAEPRLVAGGIVAGRFEILAVTGRGGFGTVYRAGDRVTGCEVALKVLRDPTNDVARFERESELLATIRHPNVVSYIAHGLTEDRAPYLAMDWLEGIDLSEKLRKEALSVQESLTLAMRAAQGLAAAHTLGIVHRDVKPSNLYLVGFRPEDVRVIDFGVARAPSPLSVLTATGAVIGTPAYMAPEQARGARDLSPSVDVFALGSVLFECLTGEPPFTAPNAQALIARLLTGSAPRLAERRPDLPPILDALLSRMLAHDPADRFPDAGAAAMAIAAVLTEAPQTPPVFGGVAVVTSRAMRAYSSLLVRAAHGRTLPAALDPLVASLGGEVLTRSGDLLVSVFAADAPADSAQRAARCAVALRDQEVSLRIGITTARRDTAVAAPSAVKEQIGMFLEDAASGDLLLDPTTAAHLRGEYELERRGALVALSRRRSPVLESGEGILGRTRELAALAGVCAEVIEERCARVALVLGEAGMGKTRLLVEMLRRLGHTRPDAAVLRAFGDKPTSTSPFALIRQLVRWKKDDERPPIASGASALTAARRPPLSEVDADFLDELAQLHAARNAPAHVQAARRDPMLMADAFRCAWLAFVDGLLLRGPLVLLVEDLHHADLASVRLIEVALEQFSDRSLLVVGTARPEEAKDTLAVLGPCDPQEIALRPLRAEIAGELVRGAIGDALPDTVAQIVARGAGNPLRLLELARLGTLDPALDSASGAVEARFARLDPFARRVLRAASVFGMHFTPSGLCALLGGEARQPEILSALSLAEEQRFVTREKTGSERHDEGWSFRHGLVQEGAYATLTDPERRAAHATVGRWLSRHPGIAPSLVAWHFERASERRDAFLWYEAAAQAALQGRDLERVALLTESALECRPSGEGLARISLLRAEAALLKADATEGKRAATQAMDASIVGSATWARAAGILITSAGQRGDNADVARLADLVRTTSPEDSATAEWVICLCRAAMQLFSAGERPAARSLLAAVETCGVDDGLAKAWTKRGLAGFRVIEHDYDGAIALQADAVRLHAAAGDVRNACLSRIILASMHIFAIDFENGAAELDVAEPMARRTGADYFIRWASYARGKLLALAGEPHAARLHLEHVRRELIGSPRIVAGTHIYAALAALRARDGGWAEAESRAALAAHSAPAIHGVALAVLARALVLLGRASEAFRAAQDALAVLRKVGSIEENEGLVYLAVLETTVACGLEEDARVAAQIALDRLSAIARKLSTPARRERYLYGTECHAETVRLAHQLGLPAHSD